MSDLESTTPGLPERRGFSPVEAAIGVIMRPGPAMRSIALARPWLIALALYIAIALLNGLANLTATPQPLDGMEGAGDLPPEFRDMMEGMIAFTQDPTLIFASAVIISPIILVILSGILYLVGRLLGGRGPFSSLLSTQAYASVPSLLLAPVTAVLNLGGGLFGMLSGLLSFGVGVWVIVLQIIGIRESLSLTTGRAVATFLIPFAILILLVCAFVILAVVIIAGAIGGAGA